MNLYEAIFVRKSIWSFQMEPVDKKVLDNLMNFANHLEMLLGDQKVNFQIINNLDAGSPPMKAFIKAPYYFILSSMENEDYLINAGYLLEQIALYLTTKGLATCFLELHKMHFQTVDGYEPIMILGFGKTDKVVHRDPRKVHRFKLEELCTFRTNASDNIKMMLQAARFAPSIMNNQPWRFVVIENRIHVFNKKEMILIKQYNRMKQVDIGMMLANLLVSAEELWLNTEVVKLENISERTFKKNEYIVTVRITG